MIMRYADPFDTLFAFQQALENRQLSDWLGSSTAGMGSYPPINVFQQGDDLVAIIELPGVIQSRSLSEELRISGMIDQDKITAELSDGVITLVLPKAERAKPRRIAIG
jgi:HSP20 family protein